MTASLRPSIAGGRTRYSGAIYTAAYGAAAVESIAMDGQSIGSKVAAAVTHNSDSQKVLGRGTRLGLGSRRTRYTVGGHTK